MVADHVGHHRTRAAIRRAHKDFAALAMLGVGPMVVTGRPGIAAETFPELIDLAHSSALNYGSGGVATFMNLVAEAINAHEKVQIVHTVVGDLRVNLLGDQHFRPCGEQERISVRFGRSGPLRGRTAGRAP